MNKIGSAVKLVKGYHLGRFGVIEKVLDSSLVRVRTLYGDSFVTSQGCLEPYIKEELYKVQLIDSNKSIVRTFETLNIVEAIEKAMFWKKYFFANTISVNNIEFRFPGERSS